MDTQYVRTVPHLGLTSASTWLHVTELHVCKCTWYSKRFFVINTTLTCIPQMIIWLCESACIYALGIQRVNDGRKALPYIVEGLWDLPVTSLVPCAVRLGYHNNMYIVVACIGVMHCSKVPDALVPSQTTRDSCCAHGKTIKAVYVFSLGFLF